MDSSPLPQVIRSQQQHIKVSAMKKIRVALVGLGNVGRFTLDAINNAPDMELAGIVRRAPSKSRDLTSCGINVVSSIKELENVDVAILATPTPEVETHALEILSLGINTVDSFDIHSRIPGLFATLDSCAKANNATAVISAGWDPGSDSIVRALMEAIAPKGVTYTNFGPGMSMGHSVAVRSKEGVRDALSVTIPTGTGIHRRMVYVGLLPGADIEKVTADIKADPYFSSDETHVRAVESVDALKDMGHGVNLVRKGVSGNTHNQLLEFDMKINNPALTGQILVCAARASMRQAPGCYTMIEIPVIDLLPGDRGRWRSSLV